MLYPQNIEQKLGFDRVRDDLHLLCIGTLGQRFVSKIRFSNKYSVIDKLVRQTGEMKRAIEEGAGFPSSDYIDLTPFLQRAVIEGILLEAEVFADIRRFLKTVTRFTEILNETDEDFPLLKELAEPIQIEPRVIQEIDRIIDERGQVRDSASPELALIRKRLISVQNTVRSRLDSIFRNAKSNGWVEEDVSLTIRNGRMVIPVSAEYKRRLKGFVHDTSSTGQTVFIEPAEIFDSNNEIRELEHEERREINRILVILTDYIRPHIPELQKACNFLGIMDFLRAKANYAISIQAVNPHFINRQLVEWKDARHPILQKNLQKHDKKIVPVSVRLTEEHRILVISGPNAGGKSVTLKTVGLLQYMYQCGLMIPVAEESRIGLFGSILIDIGDEQSLENDLSTYSSHLTNMKLFLKNANRHTLFLIDEFGTGTEPGSGGAIAESILEKLVESGAFGVINTHYGNLKQLAGKTPGLINGAMRFDSRVLQPKYELKIGNPGSSFAFEIASKIGLPQEVVQKAKQKIGSQQVNFEKLLKELEIEKAVYAEKNLETGIKERKLAQQLAEYTALKQALENNEKQIKNQAKTEAKALIVSANQLIEKTIREIKESGAKKDQTRIAREKIEKFAAAELQVEPVAPPVAVDSGPEPEKGEITAGSYVRLKGQDTLGEVIAVKGNEAEIRIGSLKSTIKLNRLERITARSYRSATNESPAVKAKYAMDLNEKSLQFSFNLDIRGMRGEEAMVRLDQFMNNAVMLGYNELRVIHGKGDGILRTLVRNHLKGFREVTGLADEHPDRGGAGVTLVSLV